MSRLAILLVAFCALVILAASILHLTIKPAFSCESPFSILQSTNSEIIRFDGIISANMTDKNILIRIDGLFNHKEKKSIISRTLTLKYEAYNKSANLYKTISTDTFRDAADDADDEISNNLLFDGKPGKNIIFIKRSGDNLLLLGNGSFPQYACGAYRERRPFSR